MRQRWRWPRQRQHISLFERFIHFGAFRYCGCRCCCYTRVNRSAKFPSFRFRKSKRRAFMSEQPIGVALVNLTWSGSRAARALWQNSLRQSRWDEEVFDDNLNLSVLHIRASEKKNKKKECEMTMTTSTRWGRCIRADSSQAHKYVLHTIPHKIVALADFVSCTFLRCAHPDNARGVLFVHAKVSIRAQHSSCVAHRRVPSTRNSTIKNKPVDFKSTYPISLAVWVCACICVYAVHFKQPVSQPGQKRADRASMA